FDVGAGLVGLDGSDNERPSTPPPASPPATLGGLLSVHLADEGLPLTPEEPRPAAPPPRAAAPPPPAARPAPPPPAIRPAPPPSAVARPAPPPPPAAAGEDRFRPSGADSGAINLALDVVPPDPMLSTGAVKQKQDFVVPRCPRHDVPKRGGRCALC